MEENIILQDACAKIVCGMEVRIQPKAQGPNSDRNASHVDLSLHLLGLGKANGVLVEVVHSVVLAQENVTYRTVRIENQIMLVSYSPTIQRFKPLGRSRPVNVDMQVPWTSRI